MKYTLLTKNIGIKYRQYTGDAVRLSKQLPYTVDEIVVTKDKCPDFKRKITTFRNSKKQIIERVFDYSDKPYRNCLYEVDDNVIGNDEFVSTTTKRNYVIERSVMPLYKKLINNYLNPKKFIFWRQTLTEINHFSENVENGEKILTQVKIKNIQSKNNQNHIFVEYPHLKDGKVDRTSGPKSLKFSIRGKDNSVIKKSVECNGVECPQEDNFLGFRALPINEAKELFVKKFIREKGLEKADIGVLAEYNPLNIPSTNFRAIFDAEDGVVKFNQDYKFKSKSQLINTSAHEVEHAHQYALQARYNGGGTEWQNQIAETYGSIKSTKIKEEAKAYNDSIKIYVPFWKNSEAYRENYIEKCSNQKGLEKQRLYDKEGKRIRESFSHIPQELL